MWAVDDPLSENVTGSGDDFRWVEDTKGSAVPENQTYHSQDTAWAWTGLTNHVRCSTRSLETDMPRHAPRTSRRGRHADCR